MTCECGRAVADDTVPAVDFQGNPLPPMCRFCELGLVYSREKRRKARDTPASVGGKEQA